MPASMVDGVDGEGSAAPLTDAPGEEGGEWVAVRVVWPAAVEMLRYHQLLRSLRSNWWYFRASPAHHRRLTALELGAGTGMLGLSLAARLGGWSVALTMNGGLSGRVTVCACDCTHTHTWCVCACDWAAPGPALADVRPDLEVLYAHTLHRARYPRQTQLDAGDGGACFTAGLSLTPVWLQG
eukprot:gene41872-8531_t